MRHRVLAPARRTVGYTLVESVVALTLLGVGLLALATTSATFLAHASLSQERIASAVAADGVLDSLRSVPCSALAGGAANVGGVAVVWTVSGPAALRRIDLRASIRQGSRQKQLALFTERAC